MRSQLFFEQIRIHNFIGFFNNNLYFFLGHFLELIELESRIAQKGDNHTLRIRIKMHLFKLQLRWQFKNSLAFAPFRIPKHQISLSTGILPSEWGQMFGLGATGKRQR